MGCWNGTCAISNLHVTAGQDVVVFLLLENKDKKTFCYSNAMYDLCPVPFYGKYNDYGGVEECHGFGMNIVVEALRSQLYQFGQGPNSCHDIEVNKDNFDINMLFEADHEDRLGIQETQSWSHDSYEHRELEKLRLDSGLTDSQQFELDRLANKIKQVDTFRQVTHVIIHGDIFRGIINNWYIEDYVGEGKGTVGYGNSYNHIYFKDAVDSIPEYIARHKAAFDSSKSSDPHIASIMRRMNMRGGTFSYNDANLAGRWMQSFERGSSMTFGLIDVNSHVADYMEKEDWDGLAAFTKEALTAFWINAFMSSTRKTWAQTTGKGSQNQDTLGYEVLISAMSGVIAAEKAEQEEWDREDEEVDEDAPAE